ncbi:MAG: outer membrane lipid asymmetry maintenance protein MlaD [Rhodobacteraceae bacterium]|nr:outer membrane lipid asymmetry maintenance protein MlaD [Paracoccaceae bacterium]
MSENRFEALVGFLVLAVAAAFFVHLTNGKNWFGTESGYEISALFDSAQGISVGTQVRMAGVPVGSVSGVSLDSETYYASVKMKVADGLEIPDDSQAIVTSEGLLGGQIIELSPGGSESLLSAGGVISDTQGYRDLVTTLTQALLSRLE